MTDDELAKVRDEMTDEAAALWLTRRAEQIAPRLSKPQYDGPEQEGYAKEHAAFLRAVAALRENAALRAIAQAVDAIGRDASGEIVTTSEWISTCPFCQRTITGPSDFQGLGHRKDCIVLTARALLAKEAR